MKKKRIVPVEFKREHGRWPTPEELGLPPDSIEAWIVSRWGDVPDEEYDKLPPDGSYNLDHYLYGSRKKPLP